MGLVWIRVWLVDEAETTCEVKNRLAQLMGEQFRSILGYQERKVVVIVGEGFDPLKDGFCKFM